MKTKEHDQVKKTPANFTDMLVKGVLRVDQKGFKLGCMAMDQTIGDVIKNYVSSGNYYDKYRRDIEMILKSKNLKESVKNLVETDLDTIQELSEALAFYLSVKTYQYRYLVIVNPEIVKPEYQNLILINKAIGYLFELELEVIPISFKAGTL